MNIPDIIARLQKSGLTQKQIAEGVQCGQSTISDMAAGKIGRSRPSFKFVSGLLALADKRGVEVAADGKPHPKRRATDH